MALAVPSSAQRAVPIEIPIAPVGAVAAAGTNAGPTPGTQLLPPLNTQVAIIGAGPAGIAMGRELKARGVEVLLLDKANAAGGSWQDMPTNLHVLSPWSQIALPETPKELVPAKVPVPAKDYARYLQEYAAHHRLPVMTSAEITRVERNTSGRIELFLKDGRKVVADSAVNATGYFGKPFVPEYPGARESSIRRIHFAAYKDPGSVSGKKVLVVGKRLSAGQAMRELHEAGFEVELSARGKVEFMPPGADFFEKHLLTAAEWLIIKLGLKDRIPTEIPMESGRTKEILTSGAVAVRPDIARFEGNEVVFRDGTHAAYDLVLFATGFRPALDHLRGKETPGVFLLGVEGISSWRSRLIRGIRDDAPLVADRIQEFLGQRVARSPRALIGAHFFSSFNDTAVKTIFALWSAAALSGRDAGSFVSLSMALFVVPYLLLSIPAGWLADRFPKRTVVVGTRFLEIAAMALAGAALTLGNLNLLLAAFPLMGLHTVLMGPAKYGLIPELVAEKDISDTNGVLEGAGFVALVAGTALGGLLFSSFGGVSALAAPVLIGGAGVSLLFALRIPKTVKAASAAATKAAGLGMTVPLWLATLGSALFWGLAVMLQSNIVHYAGSVLHASSNALTGMLLTIALGAAAGCVAAGKLSRGEVRLGFVPLGALGFGLFMLDLSLFGAGSLARVVFDLFMMNAAAAFYVIPLDTYIRRSAPEASRGRVLGIGNLLNFGFVLAGTGALYVMSSALGWTPGAIFWGMGALGLAGSGVLAAGLRDRLRGFGRP